MHRVYLLFEFHFCQKCAFLQKKSAKRKQQKRVNTLAPSNSKTEVTLIQSDIDGNTTCTICTYSIICFSQVQPLWYTGIIVIMKSHFDVYKVITESFTKVQKISVGNCPALFQKKNRPTGQIKKTALNSTYC